ncbi:MAG: monovalent cation/H+ antiporter subunit A [Longimicrobiales bacterium]
MNLLLILLLPFIGAIPPLLAGRGADGRRTAAWVSAVPTIAALVLVLREAPQVFAGEVVEATWRWVPALGLSLSVRLDGYAWFFAALVLAIGLLILLYARYYLSAEDDAGRFFALLMLFMGSMGGIVVSGNLLALVVFWELTSLSSFLLIGYWHDQPDSRRGARMALAVTGLGGLALLAGVLLIGSVVGSYELDEVLGAGGVLTQSPLYLPILVLVLLGAFTKSAQFPFQLWLPRAMCAPTPVSAYLHSATMVKAGVFLLGRLYPALSGTTEWVAIVTTVGLTTLLVGAWAAMFAHDLKGLLAYSTISHLGLITALFGFSVELAAVAAVFHIVNHAAFKAGLFMSAGIIDHEAGTRDMRILNGLWRHMPYTSALALVASAAMAGVPLLNGFLSKEMFFGEAASAGTLQGAYWLPAVAAVLGGTLSVAYSLRFISVLFIGDGTGMPKDPHEPPRFMRVPVEILVVICLAVGILPGITVGAILEVAASGVLDGPAPEVHLGIWHGFNIPLLMSAIALGAGALVFIQRDALYRFHDRVLPRWTLEGVYEWAYKAFVRLSAFVTGGLENGSLQRYAAFLVGAAVVAGLVPALRSGWMQGAESFLPIDLVTAAGWVFLVLAAVGVAALHRQRFVALIMSGAVGLMVSLAFVRFAAPDLAMTQLLVEVVTVLLLLLALHYLPRHMPVPSSAGRRARDLALAIGGGAGMAALVWVMLTRRVDSISGYFVENSEPLGGGANIVNVILVDFRGFDTMGEITVLGIAALGVIMLLRGVTVQPIRHGVYSRDQYPVILTQVTRALMPLLLLLAIYLYLRGHMLPGGGFVAGLMAAVAIIIQYVASGERWVSERLRVAFEPWIAYGLMIAALTGVGAWVFGYPFLKSWFDHFHLPWLGDIELASAMAFDLGVFVTVVASVLLVLRRLGTLESQEGVPVDDREEASPWRA